jgi:hypothetical protein
VFLLQQLFDWLVLMPARTVALYAIVPVCSLPPLAAIGCWFWLSALLMAETTADRQTCVLLL